MGFGIIFRKMIAKSNSIVVSPQNEFDRFAIRIPELIDLFVCQIMAEQSFPGF